MNMSGLHCGKSKVLSPQVVWDRCGPDTLQRFFGYTVGNTKGKPTNAEKSVLFSFLSVCYTKQNKLNIEKA